MRHLKSKRKLNKTSSHRKAMLANMALALIKHEQIQTTLPKAKELAPYVDKLISLGKKGDLASRKKAYSILPENKWATKLFNELSAPMIFSHIEINFISVNLLWFLISVDL